MSKGFLLLYIFVAGCMGTNPPNIEEPNYITEETPIPNEPDDIEKLLRAEREPILSDILQYQQNKKNAEFLTPVQIGMPKRFVRLNMGSPSQIEVAGNPIRGNERWTYEMSIPTSNGYMVQKRLIYFEDHQVVGWELN